MDKIGWFEVVANKDSGTSPLYRGDENGAAMLNLNFFAYTKERIENDDDAFYPDAVFEISEMYAEEDQIGYWALFTVEVLGQGRDEMGEQLIELWRKMDTPHAPQLSDFLDMCREYFDEGRAAFYEKRGGRRYS